MDIKNHIIILSILFFCNSGFAHNLSIQSNITISVGTTISVEGDFAHVKVAQLTMQAPLNFKVLLLKTLMAIIKSISVHSNSMEVQQP
jgi:hypothetical protein